MFQLPRPLLLQGLALSQSCQVRGRHLQTRLARPVSRMIPKILWRNGGGGEQSKPPLHNTRNDCWMQTWTTMYFWQILQGLLHVAVVVLVRLYSGEICSSVGKLSP